MPKRKLFSIIILSILLLSLYGCLKIMNPYIRGNSKRSVNTENLSVNIEIKKDGSADITETWYVFPENGQYKLLLAKDLTDSLRFQNIKLLDEEKEFYLFENSNHFATLQKFNEYESIIEIQADTDMKQKIQLSYTDWSFLQIYDDSQETITNIFQNSTTNVIKSFSLTVTWEQDIFPEFYGMGMNTKVHQSNQTIFLESKYSLGPENKCVIALKFPITNAVNKDNFNFDKMKSRYANNPEILKQLELLMETKNQSEISFKNFSDFESKVKNCFQGFTLGSKSRGTMMEYIPYKDLPIIPLLLILIMLIAFSHFLYPKKLRTTIKYYKTLKENPLSFSFKRNVLSYSKVPVEGNLKAIYWILHHTNDSYSYQDLITSILIKWEINKNIDITIKSKTNYSICLLSKPIFKSKSEELLYEIFVNTAKGSHMVQSSDLISLNDRELILFQKYRKLLENENIYFLENHELIEINQNINVLSSKGITEYKNILGYQKYIKENETLSNPFYSLLFRKSNFQLRIRGWRKSD